VVHKSTFYSYLTEEPAIFELGAALGDVEHPEVVRK
jgi:hypothetical protein